MKTFKPKKGQTDYTHARWAPVINCVVKYRDRILLVKRSNSVGFYPGYWNGIAGFLDDRRSFEKTLKDELKEEVGISTKNIVRIRRGEIFHDDDTRYKKTWIVHPVLVEVSTDAITLDWEAVAWKWMKPSEAQKLKLVPGFRMVLKKLLL